MAGNPETKVSLEDDGPDCKPGTDDKLNSFWLWIGTLTCFGIVLAVASIILAYWLHPSFTSEVIFTVWLGILAYAALKGLWRFVLEPLYFRCSQWCSHIFG